MREHINQTRPIVAKFGGTSLSCAEQFKRVKRITERIANGGAPLYVVPSAPGKRFDGDIKVTDLLLKLFSEVECRSAGISNTLNELTGRFMEIAQETGTDFDIAEYIRTLPQNALRLGKPYITSRGEYLSGRLLANYLGYEFVDAADIIFFDEYGRMNDKKTFRAVSRRLSETNNAVIPGFYGSDIVTGQAVTFPRGGSDITGAVVARAVNAHVYQNWTDVSGFYTADPRVVKSARPVDALHFNELRELSCMGASVLHGNTVLPLIGSDISVCVKNTNDPEARGTIISPSISGQARVAGIAGHAGYTAVTITKLELGTDSSFARKVLHAFEACSIPVEHMPLSMDNISVITFTEALADSREMLHHELKLLLGDVAVEYSDNLALIATVSAALSTDAKFARLIFDGLAKHGIPIRLMDHGSGSNSIVVGVDDCNFDAAVNSIHSALEEYSYV